MYTNLQTAIIGANGVVVQVRITCTQLLLNLVMGRSFGEDEGEVMHVPITPIWKQRSVSQGKKFQPWHMLNLGELGFKVVPLFSGRIIHFQLRLKTGDQAGSKTSASDRSSKLTIFGPR